MFEIQLNEVGKRYNKEWIFKSFSENLTSSNNYAILGRNGSGKSTFLQVLSGKFEPSIGKIEYFKNSNKIEAEDVFSELSICAPYLDLFEELTLIEAITFQGKFKSYQLPKEEIVDLTGLSKSADKQLKYYSSGMKQRVKLALAILAETSLLLLDEPSNNLDAAGVEWYNSLIEKYTNNRLVIVCSNSQQHEYGFCNRHINIEDFKK